MANGAVMVRGEHGWNAAPFTIDDTAYCIAADPSNAIWVGTPSHHLYRWKSGKLDHWDRSTGLDNHVVTALLAAKSGDVWIGTTSPNTLQCFRGSPSQFQIASGKWTSRCAD